MYLLIPDLFLFFYHHNLQLLLMSFFSLVYIYSIIKTTKYLFILLPFIFLIPAYLYYISIYKTSINEQIISVILETNFNEAVHFLGSYFFIYILLFLIWIVFCLFLSIKNYKKPISWDHWSRKFFLILGTIYFSMGYYYNFQIANQIDKTIESKNEFLVEEGNAFIDDLKQTYPLGLIINSWNVYKEQKKINEAYAKNTKFNFGAHQVVKTDDKEVYVLVIGETSRRENWQLNEYNRETNPLLSKRENLINFTDFISVSNVTRESIPMMLTRKPDKQVNIYDFDEKSVITAFKEAGFKTYWLSTQQKFGAFDTSTSVYAKEADEIKFLNKIGYQYMGVYDDILVSALDKLVEQPVKKQFIVIHTLGSHYNYAHRYPLNFDYFKPSLNTVKNYSLHTKKYKRELLNSYDNSILFTDYVLEQFIKVLNSKKNTISFLMYSSDHGEDLFDKKCSQSGHGLKTARNFEIAGFVWYSDDFKKKFPLKIINLKNNKNRKINQTAIFPSLIDAADILIPNERLSRSVLKDFKKYPRLVMGGVDYDHADFIGNCREIK